ncbi:MAG: MobA/MobL family protein [Alphaproteobacteria bacterium]|nr:MobA/MobL family protein [Alphaproteobacteria bacterium]
MAAFHLRRLAGRQLDLDIRIDHRSFEDQGIDLEPQPKIGPAAARLEARGRASERVEDHRAVARRNGDLIIRDPAHALEALTYNQASFSRHDLARFVFARTDGKDQFDLAMGAVLSSSALVRLGEDVVHGRWRTEAQLTSILKPQPALVAKMHIRAAP